MESLNVEEFINGSLGNEKLFDSDLELDPNEYLSMNRDVNWFNNEHGLLDGLGGGSIIDGAGPVDEEEKLALIDDMLSKTFGLPAAINFNDGNISCVGDICVKHTSGLDNEDGMISPTSDSTISDSSDVDSLEQNHTSKMIKMEPVELIEAGNGATEVPIAVATIILESNSNEEGMKHELEDEYLSMEQEIEIHHNYSCSNKYASNSSVNKSGGRAHSSSSSPTPSVNIPGSRKSNRGARSKPITDLVLTDEEKRLLGKEGYYNFPASGMTLNKHEEKILRKIRRKIRNKRSAQCSRQRKKEYLEELERKYDRCSHENHGLRREVLKLRKENDSLMMKVKRLIFLNTGSGGNAGTGGGGGGQASLKTSFFVMILSFLLILVPFFRPDGMEDNLMNLMGEKQVIGTGRHLLMALSNETENHGYYYYSPSSSFNDSIDTLFNPGANYISY